MKHPGRLPFGSTRRRLLYVMLLSVVCIASQVILLLPATAASPTHRNRQAQNQCVPKAITFFNPAGHPTTSSPPNQDLTYAVSLTAPAAGDCTATVSASDPEVTFPNGASLTIPAGKQTSDPQPLHVGMPALSPVVITADFGAGKSIRANLFILGSHPVCKPIWMTLNPSSLVGPGSVQVTVQLYSAAPSGGCTGSLTSSNNAIVLIPGGTTIKVPAGNTVSNPVTLQVNSVSSSASVTITASFSGGNIASSECVLSSSLAVCPQFPSNLEAMLADCDDILQQVGGIGADSGVILVTIDQANTTLTSIATLIDQINARHQQQTPAGGATPPTTPPP